MVWPGPVNVSLLAFWGRSGWFDDCSDSYSNWEHKENIDQIKTWFTSLYLFDLHLPLSTQVLNGYPVGC